MSIYEYKSISYANKRGPCAFYQKLSGPHTVNIKVEKCCSSDF